MRTEVVETMVNTIEKIAKDNQLTPEEYKFSVALLMMELMQHQTSNPMNIVMDEDMTLMVYLKVNTAKSHSSSKDDGTVH